MSSSAEIEAEMGQTAPVPAMAADSDRLARLLDQTGQPFVLLDLEARIIRANRAFARLLGYEESALLGRSIQEFTPPHWRELTATVIRTIRETGQAQRYEKEYLHRDGTPIPVALVTDFERDEQGEPRGSFAFVTDMRERKRSEEKLRASEERFRQLFDEAPFGYHVLAADGTLLSVNRTECEMLGYPRDDLLGRPIFDFVVEAEREDARRGLANRVGGAEEVQEVERTFRTRDGRERVFAVASRLLTDIDGRVVGVRGTMQDITPRRQAELALVASERRLRALFEGIEDAIFVHDLQGRILDANPAACRRLGYSREELLQLSTRDVDAPEFSGGYSERLQAQLRHGRLSIEGRHRTKDGRLIPVDINTSLIHLEETTAVLAVIRDITERKALEETRRQYAEAQVAYAREMETKARELSRSEERYRQLTASLHDALIVCDAEGSVTLFNRAAERTFGIDAADVIGSDLARLIPDAPSDSRAEMRSVRSALVAADPRLVGQTIEAQGLRGSGETFPIELAVAAVASAPGDSVPAEFVALVRDLTERNRMRAMLLQTEKLASIGLLSAGVAHEINNPLAFIANNLAVLDRDLDGVLEMIAAYESAGPALETAAPEAARRVREIAEELDWEYVRGNLRRMIDRTRDGVKRVAAIVQNLRGMARTSPTQLEHVAVGELIDAALEMLAPRLRRSHITIEVDKSPLPKLPCVPAQIGQVILNLVVNATQAVEEAHPSGGGRVSVKLWGEPETQRIEVSDNGPGIPAEAMARLFDPFYTTKPVGEGTGLGLSISHSIIDAHEGRIEIESRPGQGATFRVILPEKTR